MLPETNDVNVLICIPEKVPFFVFLFYGNVCQFNKKHYNTVLISDCHTNNSIHVVQFAHDVI